MSQRKDRPVILVERLCSNFTSPGRSQVKEMDDGGDCRRALHVQHTNTHGGGMCKADLMGKLMDCGINGKINDYVTYSNTPQTFPNTQEGEKSTSSSYLYVLVSDCA